MQIGTSAHPMHRVLQESAPRPAMALIYRALGFISTSNVGCSAYVGRLHALDVKFKVAIVWEIGSRSMPRPHVHAAAGDQVQRDICCDSIDHETLAHTVIP